MIDKKELLKLLVALNYISKEESKDYNFDRMRPTALYKKEAQFKKFLDSKTGFLPKSTGVICRWLHYRDGASEEKVCLYCGGRLKNYRKTYCTHKCSTLAPKLGAKTGPKVDLGKKLKELKVCLPDYEVLNVGQSRSTFRHSCGREFEAGNYALSSGRVKCTCEHARVMLRTEETIRSHLRSIRSSWSLVSYKQGSSKAKLKHSKCGHVHTLSNFYYDRRCPTCFPNKFCSNIVTHEVFSKRVKKRHPEIDILTEYVDGGTKLKCRHKKCKSEFEVSPGRLVSKKFECPLCAPRSIGSYRYIVLQGRSIRLRGKEHLALKYILKASPFKLKDIQFDSDGTVPRISFRLSGQPRSYWPDMYVSRANLLIEVKDVNSLGLGSWFHTKPGQLWRLNCAKAKACLKNGYEFKLILFKGSVRISVPKDWYTYSRAEMISYINNQ